MIDGQVAPVVAQILGDQSAVTVFGCGLTAKQHRGNGKQAAVDTLFDASLAHQREKAALICFPTAFLLSVLV